MSSTSLPVCMKATQSTTVSVTVDGNAHSGSCSVTTLKKRDKDHCSAFEMGPDAMASSVDLPVRKSLLYSSQENASYGEFELVDVVVDENKENTQVVAHSQVPLNNVIDNFICTKLGLTVDNAQGDSLLNLLVQNRNRTPGRDWQFFDYSNVDISDWDQFDEREELESLHVSLEYDV